MNPKPVVLRDRALRDLVQVVEFYSSGVSLPVARSFAAATQEVFWHLSYFPATGSLRYGREFGMPDLRLWPVSGFPYLVLYVEQESSIDIYRILHTARDIPASLTEGNDN